MVTRTINWCRSNRRTVAFIVLWAASTLGLYFISVHQSEFENEVAQRRGQSCKISETKQAKDVKQLVKYYEYLLALSPEERNQTINKFIFKTLPDVELEASTDDAPDFCDEPGVGLPEPDMKIPARPKVLDEIYGAK